MSQSNCSQNYSYSGATEPKRVSACEEAYNSLRVAQEEQALAIERLFDRLAVAVCDSAPKTGGSVSQIANPTQSELHGWFVAATNRANVSTARINELIDRLTV